MRFVADMYNDYVNQGLRDLEAFANSGSRRRPLSRRSGSPAAARSSGS